MCAIRPSRCRGPPWRGWMGVREVRSAWLWAWTDRLTQPCPGTAPPVCPFTSVRAPSTCQARRYFVCPHLGVYQHLPDCFSSAVSICQTAFLQLSEPCLPARYEGHSFNGPDLCVCHFTLPGNLSIPARLPFCTWLVAFLYLAGCLSIPGRLPFYTCQLAFLHLVVLLPFYTCLVVFLHVRLPF